MFSSRNYGCRFSEFRIFETSALAIENELVRIGVLTGKGADIYEFLDKKTDTDYMFRERRGLERLDGFIPSVTTSQGAFWDYMVGGWFELFPNSGNASHSQSAEIGQHGEVFLQPWSWRVLCDTPECVSIEFSVRTKRTPFLLKRTMTLRSGNPTLQIKEQVTNDGGCKAEFLWGHHITFGEGFLNGHCIIDLPDCSVINEAEYDGANSRIKPGIKGSWNALPGKDGRTIDGSRVLPRDSGVCEMLFATDMDDHWFAINDPQKPTGIAVCWDGSVFRSLWVWEEYCASEGWPLYKDTYALALEPQVSEVPVLHNASKAGKTIWLQAGETVETWLTATVFHDDRRVAKVRPDGAISYH